MLVCTAAVHQKPPIGAIDVCVASNKLGLIPEGARCDCHFHRKQF